MAIPQKKFIITYQIPGNTVIHSSNTITENSIIEAKNKFKMGNPTKKIISCVKVLG
ncbi:MAG: hypothetical protein IKQ23_09905 [Treponema sp.]|nr:hypothetical protein [Treponema sp.]